MAFFLFIYPLLLAYAFFILGAILIFYVIGICVLIPIFPFKCIVNNGIGDTIQFYIGKRSKALAVVFVVLLYPILVVQVIILFVIRIIVWLIGRFSERPEFNNELIGEVTEFIAIIAILPCFIV